MKAVRIKKTFRNGEKIHFLLIGSDATDEDIEDAVKYWAEEEGSGQSYGYKIEWATSTDKEELRKLVQQKIKNNNERMFQIEIELITLNTFLHTLD